MLPTLFFNGEVYCVLKMFVLNSLYGTLVVWIFQKYSAERLKISVFGWKYTLNQKKCLIDSSWFWMMGCAETPRAYSFLRSVRTIEEKSSFTSGFNDY